MVHPGHQDASSSAIWRPEGRSSGAKLTATRPWPTSMRSGMDHPRSEHLRRHRPGCRVGPPQPAQLGAKPVVLSLRLVEGLADAPHRLIPLPIVEFSDPLQQPDTFHTPLPACSMGPTRSISHSAALRRSWKSFSMSRRSSTVTSAASSGVKNRLDPTLPALHPRLCAFPPRPKFPPFF